MKLSDIHIILSEVRRERNLAQKDIAGALNIEQAAVSMYENGKRGIPLEILDNWLKLLEIEVKITPKGYEPTRSENETRDDLDIFCNLKKRRNYLIAELRAMMAENVTKLPELQGEAENEEPRFWAYSFFAKPQIGLLETRYDHLVQKNLVVEYTEMEVNIYKFVLHDGITNGKSDRVYFAEDDFLTLGWQWNQEDLENHKITILRKNPNLPDGVEIIHPEGFAIKTLLEMQGNYIFFARAVEEVRQSEKYIQMSRELESTTEKILDVAMENRLSNGCYNDDFELWSSVDKEAIDIPLRGERRTWEWVEEGVEWKDDILDSVEVPIVDDSIQHEHFHTLRHENGNRVIGLIGTEQWPAVFKSDVKRLVLSIA